MRLFLLTCLFFVKLLAHGTALAQSEMEVRNSIENSVAKAFLGRNFSKLEADSAAYRNTKTRTPSGLWKLTVFYVGIGDAISQSTNQNPANFAGVEAIANDWVVAYPQSPTAHIVQSIVMYYHGIAFRGNRYAKDVDPSAWKPFHEFVASAKANLEKHKAVASVDPEWYEMMLIFGRNESWDKAQFMALLDEGLKREPGFYQDYFAALDYLLPKWSGSLSEVEDFAVTATKKTAGTEGSGMYARIYWYASQSHFGPGLFLKSNVRWPAMRKSFDDVLAKYPDAWNLNNYAKFACLANDGARAKELLAKIGTKNLVPQAWDDKQLLSLCQDLAARS